MIKNLYYRWARWPKWVRLISAAAFLVSISWFVTWQVFSFLNLPVENSYEYSSSIGTVGYSCLADGQVILDQGGTTRIAGWCGTNRQPTIGFLTGVVGFLLLSLYLIRAAKAPLKIK